MSETLDRRSAIYWIVLLVVTIYAGVTIVSAARVIGEEQEHLLESIINKSVDQS